MVSINLSKQMEQVGSLGVADLSSTVSLTAGALAASDRTCLTSSRVDTGG